MSATLYPHKGDKGDKETREIGQGYFILTVTRSEIHFRANSLSPLKRTKRQIISRF